jgi:hypothetical protein
MRAGEAGRIDVDSNAMIARSQPERCGVDELLGYARGRVSPTSPDDDHDGEEVGD